MKTGGFSISTLQLGRGVGTGASKELYLMGQKDKV